ncbi:MAG: DHH family phosphoesterase [Verrucomicrobia bacterium]|nr:MAG: DHH family phosphoesterase [Verrucomicrobiota bacterium]
MADLPKPDVILVHESDLDGFLSGLLLQRLARELFGETPRLEAWFTHAWHQRPLSEPSAWVADLAFAPRMDRPGWLIIDHHPVAAQPRRARLIHDPAKSSSLLCFELCRQHRPDCVNEATERLVRLSHVADLYLHEEPDFDEALDYAGLLKTYSFWNLYELLDGEPEKLLDHPLLEVVRTRRRVEDPLGLEWSRRRIEPLTPEVSFVPVVIGNGNQIVHRLLQEEAVTTPVLLTLYRQPGGVITASLRSRDGQALELAQRLQGGGHPNAAGAALPRSVRTIPQAIEYLRQALQPPAPTAIPQAGMANLLESFDASLRS